ncbi:MAG TPA: tetratricopeptide repeat protein, partial [Candidatus Dormibacteraeota bacterium]|nr:tetratricopeptide repeat protein [Candidatus Dormibacteraeota bacterium]
KAELDQIPAEQQSHPDALRVRWAVHAAAKEWDRAIVAAEAVARAVPDDSFGYVHQAFALHELKQTQQAWDLLQPLADHFPKEYLIRYNLACYACQLGRIPEALKLLQEAAKIGGDKINKMALADPDLAPLKDSIPNP